MSSGIMDSNNNIESALTNLIELSSKKGFLVFDDIYDVADKWNLSIKDIDYLSSSIATRGILVYDEAPVIDTADTSFDDYDDYAHRDYDAIFDKVIELDPGLEDFITAIRNVVPPQTKEMDQLKHQIQEGNVYARERAVQMHLRFAVRIALQRAEVYNTEIADILQEACIGLITAVDKYDPDSSGPFGSYASLWILQNISRTQGTQRPSIYYPVHKKEGYFTIYPIMKEEGYLDLDTEEIWTDKEIRGLIQNKLGCKAAQAEDIITQAMPIESLDDLYEKSLVNYEKSDKQRSRFYNRYEDVFYWYEDGYINIEQVSLRKALEDVMKELRPREKEVIRARYGLDSGAEKTLEEVGKMLGVTRERVRQIESKAIKKLQQSKKIKILQDFL